MPLNNEAAAITKNDKLKNDGRHPETGIRNIRIPEPKATKMQHLANTT